MKGIQMEETAQRNSNTKYKNKPCKYWNSLLYYSLLEDDCIHGISINEKEFLNYFISLSVSDIYDIFYKIKHPHRNIIYLEDFDFFLNHLHLLEYNELMNCLEEDYYMIDLDIEENNYNIAIDNISNHENDVNEVNIIIKFFRNILFDCIK